MFEKCQGTAYPYNVYGILVPGYTASSTEAEGKTELRYLGNMQPSSSFSNVSDLALKQTYKQPSP